MIAESEEGSKEDRKEGRKEEMTKGKHQERTPLLSLFTTYCLFLLFTILYEPLIFFICSYD